ncbi:TOTE conflict system archaeo-eukaryotic primase domain-containing protein [Lacticaseibacillus chiayiensis]|uniref:TOTE conflict system primase domain-containing protein n=1 Tax=Lacticaseibacillus chiayiensis TaxID=2100821 RepID=A0ABY6H509_9LACO|nr:hypothetical protein [Lacticaseibacillus chiayiensis]UYN55584.1 hypothetical protein OFW50_08775 [Lacticaseibacillus chiayiensis]
MGRTYTLAGKQYDYVNKAKDLGAQGRGDIVILQDPISRQYFCIPERELQVRMGNDLADHLALYKERIVGRTDVYAHRYFNKKAQKEIYGPYPIFKEGHPVKNAYAPLTDQDIIDHLDGTQFLGFYPMLKGNLTKQLILDFDGHHDAAYTYDQVIKRIRSHYLYGLSATPYRRDGLDPILVMRYGPIRYQTEAIDSRFALEVARHVIPRYTSLGIMSLEMATNSLAQNREAVLHDEPRNQAILRDIRQNLAEGRHVLLLTDLRAHVDELAAALPEKQVYKLYGGQKRKKMIRLLRKWPKQMRPMR